MWSCVHGRVDRSRVYKIGSDGAYPYHRVKDGVPGGFVAEILNEAARRQNIKLEWVVSTREHSEEALTSGDVDLWPLRGLDSRGPGLHATEPWLYNDFAFVAIKPEFRVPDNKKQIATIAVRDQSNARALAAAQYPEAEIVLRKTREEAVEMVCSGKADGAVIELRVASYFIANPPPACLKKTPCYVGISFRGEPMATYSRPQFAAVADTLKSEIDRMAEDGTLDKILLPWSYFQTSDIHAFYHEKQERRWFWKAIALLSLSVLLALGLAWAQRRFRKLERVQQIEHEESAAKTRFMRKMSHELRTPLNGIFCATELLEHTHLDDEQRDLMAIVQQSGNTLLRLVEDLLDLARLERRTARVAHDPFSLPAVIQAALAPFRVQANEKGVGFETSGIDTIPERVVGDPARVRQILSNLLSNAVKFTSKGVIRVDVSAASAAEHIEFRVVVSDTGRGIAPERIPNIFEESINRDRIFEPLAGLGLGLAITAELVRYMGGKIIADSIPGVGSRFEFTLPLLAAPPESADPGHGPAEAPPLRLSLLVVDDDAMNRVVLKRMLTALGCEVELASSGEEALDRIERSAFDAIVVDLWMPGMDGMETTRRIRRIPALAQIPIVGCTASGYSVDADRAVEAGMNQVLTKPIEPARLRSVLSELRAATNPIFAPPAQPLPEADSFGAQSTSGTPKA